MPNALPQSYGYRDARGMTAQVRILLDATATVAQAEQNGANIRVDINALTNAAPQGAHGPYTENVRNVNYGAAGGFQDAADKAVFFFQDGAGRLHKYQIPAPISSMFLVDQETIDPSNAGVKQFVADMLNVTFNGTAPTTGQTKSAVTANGSPLITFLGGERTRQKLSRKANIFTLGPTETVDEPEAP